MKPIIHAVAALLVVCLLMTVPVIAAEQQGTVPVPEGTKPLLQKGDRLVFCGDSISAMCKYTVLVDLYLAACRPELETTRYQDAISGETTAMFLPRMDQMLARTKPTIVTSFYGWNDGGWVAYKDENGNRYETNTRELLKRFADAKVRVLLASPGAAGPKLENMDVYNQTLGRIRDIGRKVAGETNTPFMDVHDTVVTAQQKMQAREGAAYDIVGNDGAHANWQAHMAMATAFLRGLGLGGEPLAKIELDHATGKATASEGHRVVSVKGNTMTVESSRYPFFFLWDNPGADFHDMPKVAEELGFFNDLDRYILVVSHLPAGKYDVTWDKVSLEFTDAELAAGVNLAHVFHRTPFDAPLYQLWQLSLGKCNIDAVMTVDAVHKYKGLAGFVKQIESALPDETKGVDVAAIIEKDPMKIHDMLEAKQKSVVKPVTYDITITPK